MLKKSEFSLFYLGINLISNNEKLYNFEIDRWIFNSNVSYDLDRPLEFFVNTLRICSMNVHEASLLKHEVKGAVSPRRSI